MNKQIKDNNIVIKSRFLTSNNKEYGWMTSTDISNAKNKTTKSQYASGMDYRSSKTECIIQLEPKANGKTGKTASYLDYFSRDFKVTSEGHITSQGILRDKRSIKEWQKQNPIVPKSVVWDQVISFKQEYFQKHQLFEMEDAQRVLNKTIDQFFRDNKMDPTSMRWVSQWHVDKAHHFHMHIRIHQTKESIRDWKTGKLKVRTKGKFTSSSFNNWKDRIDLELNKERKAFKNLGLERDKVKYKVLGGFEDAKTVNKIINDARLIKSMLPKGRMQYNSIKDPIVKKLVDDMTFKLIESNNKTNKAFKGLNSLIDKKKNVAINDLKLNQNERTIQSLNKLAKDKKKEMFVHLANQALKRIKSISTQDPKIDPKFEKTAAIKNSINRNNDFIRKFHSKNELSKAIEVIDRSMGGQLNEISRLAKKNALEAEMEIE